MQLFTLSGSQVCPVGAVREFLEARPARGGLFLLHGDGSYLSTFQFTSVFWKSLQAAGLDYTQYASHSFHIGAAMKAARCGMYEAAVKRIGRWESKIIRTYICPQLLVD